MDDVCDGSPDAEVVVRADADSGVFGVRGDEPSLSLLEDEVLEGVLAVELANRDFVRCGVAVALVHDDDVTAEHSRVDG